MRDRGFNETDLRLMLEDASGYHKDVEAGRWVIETSHDQKPWEVIVEPIPDEVLGQRLVEALRNNCQTAGGVDDVTGAFLDEEHIVRETTIWTGRPGDRAKG